jgi:hypothetical protein
MKKINDWFLAGLIAGIIGGMGLIIYNFGLLLLGVPTGTYWKAMGGLFYNKQLLNHWLAQIHGVIDALGVSGANGVLLAFTLKYTGTDYWYPKSIALSAAGAYFLFIVVYPHTGLGRDNPYTPWVALFGHTVFCGWLAGFVLRKIGTLGQPSRNETALDHSESVITILPGVKTLPEMECSESLPPIPDWSINKSPIPDYGQDLPSILLEDYEPPKKRKGRFVKPQKLNHRNK